VSYDPADYPDLPFTGIEEGQEGEEKGVVRPIYADGTRGEPDSDLMYRLHAGEFGQYQGVIGFDRFTYVPFIGQPHMTPFGPTAYLCRRGDLVSDYTEGRSRMNDASLAEQRRLSQGHFLHYDDVSVYYVIYNEGIEYGLCSYIDVHTFNERVRPLALAAETAIDAREDYINSVDFDGGEKPDEEKLTALIEEAESAKQVFMDYLADVARANDLFVMENDEVFSREKAGI
jgi:hypothetical protein